MTTFVLCVLGIVAIALVVHRALRRTPVTSLPIRRVVPVKRGHRYAVVALDGAAATTALAEAMDHFSNLPDDNGDDAVEFLASLLGCGVSPAQLKPYTAGNDSGRAVVSVLEAIGTGALVLTVPAPRRGASVLDDAGLSVLDEVPAVATFLCSSCLLDVPRARIRVVPTFDAPRQAYLGSYRCELHWKPSLDETRNGFLERAETDLEFEAGALLSFLVTRGITRDMLRVHTTGKMPVDAVMAVFDEIEEGRFVLEV